MIDCPNAEIRDQLPDLLHDRLSVSARAVVVAHVSSCADCRDELELLRGVREVLVARAPRVDVAWVVGALPKPAARRPQVTATRRPWTDWRVAAAVTLFVAGGTSVAVYNGVAVSGTQVAVAPLRQDSGLSSSLARSNAATIQNPSTPSSGIATSSPAPSPNAKSVETVASADDQSSSADLATEGRLGELSEQQLRALLGDIERLPAVPVTDPEPVMIRVNHKGSSSPEGQ